MKVTGDYMQSLKSIVENLYVHVSPNEFYENDIRVINIYRSVKIQASLVCMNLQD